MMLHNKHCKNKDKLKDKISKILNLILTSMTTRRMSIKKGRRRIKEGWKYNKKKPMVKMKSIWKMVMKCQEYHGPPMGDHLLLLMVSLITSRGASIKVPSAYGMY